jgi:hypothetical protein
LSRLADAIASAPACLQVVWHVGFDLDRQHIGGQAVKNRLLNEIHDGWVWVCDDDNLPVPGFFAWLTQQAPADLLLVAQQRQGQMVAAAYPRVDETDIAQAVIARSLIAAQRLPEVYNGDGLFLVALAAQTSKIALINEPLTAYNAQTEAL